MMTVRFQARDLAIAIEVTSPAIRGREGETVSGTTSGRCTFLKADRCELHDLGLKPQECRQTFHTETPVRAALLAQWSC